MLVKTASILTILASVAISWPASFANDAKGRFGVRLVIEPHCPTSAGEPLAADRAAPEIADAFRIAKNYMRSRAAYRNLADNILTAEHDLSDTGNWIINARGIDEPILSIEKCSGQVTPLYRE